MLLKPQVLGDGVLVGVTMIEVRRDAETSPLIRQVAPVPRHVADGGVEVIGGRQPEHRAGDAGQVGVVGNAGQLHGLGGAFDASRQIGLALQNVSRSSAGRHGGLHPGVDPREIGGELAAHGMPVHTDARRIHLRLPLKQTESAARGHQHEEPIAVPGGFNTVERVLIGRERTSKMIHLVMLRRMRGVESAPVGLGAVIGKMGPPKVQLVAAPVERERRIAALCIGDDIVETGRLTAAMKGEKGGKMFAVLREGVKGGHPRWRPFEHAHLIAHHAADHAILLPFLEHLDFQRR